MLLAFLASLILASSSPAILTVPVVHVEELTKEWTVEEMKALAVEKATAHNLHVGRFLATIACESDWNRFAVGDNGLSHGLAQFHRPLRDWGITREEAYDPEIALEIMATAFERGEAYRWTCWRNLPR